MSFRHRRAAERAWAALARWGVRLLAFGGVFTVWALLLLLAAGLGVRVTTARDQAFVDREWERIWGAEGVVGRYPPTERNRTAVRLAELGGALGVSFERPLPVQEDGAGGAADDRAPSAPEAGGAAADDPLRAELWDYFQRLERAEAPGLEPLPEAVGARLADSRPALEAIVELLLTAEPPVEERDLARGPEAPLPDFLPYLHLNRRLLALAVDESLGGDDEAAGRAVEASWRLTAPLAERPELIAHLLWLANLEGLQAVARARPALGADLRRRLAEVDPRAGALTALRLEAWLTSTAALQTMEELPVETLRWMFVNHTRTMLETVAELERGDVLAVEWDGFTAAAYSRIPRWNIPSRMLMPNVWDTWPRSHRAAVDLDLTRRILDLCADGFAGAAGERREASVVDGLDWVCRRRADGAAEVRLDGRIDPRRDFQRRHLSLSFSLGLEDCE